MSDDTYVTSTLHDAGMTIRREVLGDPYVDSSTSHVDALTVEFQQFMTTYCWGEVWTDDRLTRLEHSLIVLATTAALGKTREFEIHARGALRNGLRPEQLTAVARQIAVYAGVPAAVSVLPSLRTAIEDHQREVNGHD
jgi:alkylhydroperoxidase/carboxymuconolactone decarboxylase family protein YurZ